MRARPRPATPEPLGSQRLLCRMWHDWRRKLRFRIHANTKRCKLPQADKIIQLEPQHQTNDHAPCTYMPPTDSTPTNSLGLVQLAARPLGRRHTNHFRVRASRSQARPRRKTAYKAVLIMRRGMAHPTLRSISKHPRASPRTGHVSSRHRTSTGTDFARTPYTRPAGRPANALTRSGNIRTPSELHEQP